MICIVSTQQLESPLNKFMYVVCVRRSEGSTRAYEGDTQVCLDMLCVSVCVRIFVVFHLLYIYSTRVAPVCIRVIPECVSNS